MLDYLGKNIYCCKWQLACVLCHEIYATCCCWNDCTLLVQWRA